MPSVVLPYMRVTWDTPVSGAGIYVQTNVKRREAGSAGSGTRIAVITNQATTEYRDHTATSYTLWEYAITQTENISGEIIESAETWTQGTLRFKWAYVHSVHDAAQYVHFPAFDIGTDIEQEVQLRTAWGRSRPTAFVGELDFARVRLGGLADIERGQVWAALRPLVSLQATAAAIYCVRIGVSGERYFANITAAGKQAGEKAYEPRVDITETYFEEDV